MNRVRFLATTTLLALSAFAAAAQPFGLSNRPANTTLNFPQTPPAFTYTTTNAFPTNLVFGNPIALATPPGETNRLFVLERSGRLTVISNLAAPNRFVVLDFTSRGLETGGESGALGLAFDPNFASNRYFYVFYTLSSFTGTQGTGRHQRLSRFQMTLTNNNVALLTSEMPLITQRDEASNHNGGDLHFGPDGYLYVSLGDEGMQNDFYNNTQTLYKDFFSGILRLDPNTNSGNALPNFHPAHQGTTNYLVPTNNPWRFNSIPTDTNAAGNLRTEFYILGLRNPWRFSFDTNTGWMWIGDVGGGAREEIDVVTNGGGNYGWAFREGFTTGPKAAETNSLPPVTTLNPIFDYGHGTTTTNVGNSITGGFVYRGTNLPALTGAYVYSDYVSGNVWSLRYSGTTVSNHQLLFQDTGFVNFGRDPHNGDVFICDFVANSNTNWSQLRRLILNPDFAGALPAPFLSGTGAFTNLSQLRTHAGIIPYEINVPFWSDNGLKRRWFSLPNTNQQITWTPEGNWSFPTGTVWMKHFNLVLNEASNIQRRLETRFLVKHPGGIYGLTYRWGTSTTEATLIDEFGMNETFTITNADNATTRSQTWRYPSRNECLICHTPVAGFALGFNTPQMNCSTPYTNFTGQTGLSDNNLRAMNNVGYFNPPVSNLTTLRALAGATNTAYSLEYRVRSYLQANCAHCHQPGGSGLGFFDAQITTPTSLADLVNGALNNNAGNANARVIVPGSTNNSMIHTRVDSLATSNRMPPLATSVRDTNNLALLNAWINSAELAAYQSFATWQTNNFGSTNAPGSQSGDDPDGDGVANELEWALGTGPNDATSNWRVDIQRNGTNAQIVYHHAANRAFEVQWRTNLEFEIPWQTLNVAGNTPQYPTTAFTNVVTDPALGTASNKTYRVRVLPP